MVPQDDTVQRNEMTAEEIDNTLSEQGYGTLSLARDDSAYAVPISFGYDDERLFLYLIQFGDGSEKLEFKSATDRACLTVYDVESRFDWRSVVVTGTFRPVPEQDEEYMESVMDDNAWHPSLWTNATTAPITGIHRTELEIENVTGRKGEQDL